MKTDVAAAIRAQRSRLQLSSTEYAERIGVTISAVSHWESGRQDPLLKNLERCASLEGITVSQLLGGLEA